MIAIVYLKELEHGRTEGRQTVHKHLQLFCKVLKTVEIIHFLFSKNNCKMKWADRKFRNPL